MGVLVLPERVSASTNLCIDTDDYPELGLEYDPDVLFSQLIEAYEETDSRDWKVKVEEESFKSWWTDVEDSPINLIKVRSTYKVSPSAFRNVA